MRSLRSLSVATERGTTVETTCSNCGSGLSAGTRFCPACGQQLSPTGGAPIGTEDSAAASGTDAAGQPAVAATPGAAGAAARQLMGQLSFAQWLLVGATVLLFISLLLSCCRGGL